MKCSHSQSYLPVSLQLFLLDWRLTDRICCSSGFQQVLQRNLFQRASIYLKLLSLSHVATFVVVVLCLYLHHISSSSSHTVGNKQPNSFIIFFFPSCLTDASTVLLSESLTTTPAKLMTATSDKVSGNNYLPISVVLLWDLPDWLLLWGFLFFFSALLSVQCNSPVPLAICSVPHMMGWETRPHVSCPARVRGEGGVFGIFCCMTGWIDSLKKQVNILHNASFLFEGMSLTTAFDTVVSCVSVKWPRSHVGLPAGWFRKCFAAELIYYYCNIENVKTRKLKTWDMFCAVLFLNVFPKKKSMCSEN